MLKQIYVSLDEAMKLPSAIKAKGGNIKKRINDEEFNKIFVVFRDLEGQQYLLAHGSSEGKLLSDKGIRYSAKEAYEILCDRGLIEEGSDINIICCHGLKVKEFQDKIDKEYPNAFTGYKFGKINFINNTSAPCTMINTQLNNGPVRLTVSTVRNIFEIVKLLIRAAL
jgi:hypothetical protein